jgi:hypothetical protein
MALGSPSGSPAYVAYTFEAGVALASTLTVAPIIAIVDKAIFSNASGKEALGASIRHSISDIVSQPSAFFRSPAFRWIWLVYAGTYVTANSISLYFERAGKRADGPKFFGTSAANVTLSVMKDRAFSRLYGVVAPKPVPLPSLALFASRDSLSILASFTLPTRIATALNVKHGVDVNHAYMLAQVTAPLAAQIVSTPLHLLGMDVYNRTAVAPRDRLVFVMHEYAKTTLARMARVLPAFGAGGILNKHLREMAHAYQSRIYGGVAESSDGLDAPPEKWETD